MQRLRSPGPVLVLALAGALYLSVDPYASAQPAQAPDCAGAWSALARYRDAWTELRSLEKEQAALLPQRRSIWEAMEAAQARLDAAQPGARPSIQREIDTLQERLNAVSGRLDALAAATQQRRKDLEAGHAAVAAGLGAACFDDPGRVPPPEIAGVSEPCRECRAISLRLAGMAAQIAATRAVHEDLGFEAARLDRALGEALDLMESNPWASGQTSVGREIFSVQMRARKTLGDQRVTLIEVTNRLAAMQSAQLAALESCRAKHCPKPQAERTPAPVPMPPPRASIAPKAQPKGKAETTAAPAAQKQTTPAVDPRVLIDLGINILGSGRREGDEDRRFEGRRLDRE